MYVYCDFILLPSKEVFLDPPTFLKLATPLISSVVIGNLNFHNFHFVIFVPSQVCQLLKRHANQLAKDENGQVRADVLIGMIWF